METEVHCALAEDVVQLEELASLECQLPEHLVVLEEQEVLVAPAAP